MTDQKTIIAALKNKGVSLACRECGAKGTTVDPDFAAIAQWKSGEPKPGKELSVVAQLTCTTCGNIRLFQVGVLTK